MSMNFSFEDKQRMENRAPRTAHALEPANKEDFEVITQALVKITRRTPEQIKPYLDALVERLKGLSEPPFYATATPEERARAFLSWAESHDRNTPLLSDYAVSRESMYDDER